MVKDISAGKRYTRAPSRPFLRCDKIQLCRQCNKRTWVFMCVSRHCQEHHAMRWWQERGYHSTGGRRYRGRKSEVERGRWPLWEIRYPPFPRTASHALTPFRRLCA